MECILLLLLINKLQTFMHLWKIIQGFLFRPYFSIIFITKYEFVQIFAYYLSVREKLVVCTVKKNDCNFLLSSSHFSKFTAISFKLRKRILIIHWFNWPIVSVQSVKFLDNIHSFENKIKIRKKRIKETPPFPPLPSKKN